MLASLVGQIGMRDIMDVLTRRLRRVTGDPTAERTRLSIRSRMAIIGLQGGDLLGGLTTRQAAQDIGSSAIVHHAIRLRQIQPIRVGHRLVIPAKAWQEWKAGKVFPPRGFVQLASIREALGIKSDAKLPFWAAEGYIPTAIRCTPLCTHRAGTTKFGTWYVDPKVARKLVADRRAGRPMPWHGKPDLGNLQVTFKLWTKRKHPKHCETCTEIWGQEGAPTTFDDYVRRYPPLEHGAKRHLTRTWTPGLTVKGLSLDAGCSVSQIHRAIASGQLQPKSYDGVLYVARTDAARWKGRGCPVGDRVSSWITLETAAERQDFPLTELRAFVASGELPSKTRESEANRGAMMVSRHAVVTLREQIGYTEAQAARKVGVSIPRLRTLLNGVGWRGTCAIPLVTVQAVIKRFESRCGYTVEEAARELSTSVDWVEERINDGTVRVSRAKWDQRRRYLSEPMMERLRLAQRQPGRKAERLSSDWILLSAAATLAGVSPTTLGNWERAGEIHPRWSSRGMCYHKAAVMARARTYWKTCRFKRAQRPAWHEAEQRATSA